MPTDVDPPKAAPCQGPSKAELITHCRRWIGYRQRRQHYFDRDLFDEYAWDMLLYLFVADQEGEEVTDEALVAEVGCSMPVGMRWMAHLEKEGDIRRHSGGGDTVHVTIDAGARDRMHALMAETLADLDKEEPDPALMG